MSNPWAVKKLNPNQQFAANPPQFAANPPSGRTCLPTLPALQLPLFASSPPLPTTCPGQPAQGVPTVQHTVQQLCLYFGLFFLVNTK